MAIKLVKVFLLLLFLTGVFFVYTLLDPATNKYFPVCPFYKFTGWYCAGCGSQRALHYLLTGNIKAAMASNVLLLLFLPFLIMYYAIQLYNYFTVKQSIQIGIVNKLLFIYLVGMVIIIFWILRNLPFISHNYLAPHLLDG